VPPFLTLIFSSDFASWISSWIRVERSRLTSVTSLPIVGSSPGAAAAVSGSASVGVLLVIVSPFAAVSPPWSSVRARLACP
jgi:hypothetical protein